MNKIDPIVVKLNEPVVIGEDDKAQTISELVFARKMKGKDMVAMDSVTGEVRKSMALFASMADVPLAVIVELDVDDFEHLAREVAPLMGKRGKTRLEKLDGAEKPEKQSSGG
jgi:Phage tail assembly chaperone proteins, E, or 41 or 14